MTSLPDKLRALAAFDESARVAHLESIGVSRADAEWAAQLIATEYAQLLPLIEALVRVAGAAEVVAQYGYPSRIHGTRESLAAVVDEWVTDTRDALAELERLVEGQCPPTADDSSATRTMPVEGEK